jgi:hypothetical protein
VEIHANTNPQIEDIEYPYRITSFNGPRPEKPYSHPKWGCIISGFVSSKFVTIATPNAIFDAIIADDMPYNTRTTFLSDLNHDNNLDARSIRIHIPSRELIPIQDIRIYTLYWVWIII